MKRSLICLFVLMLGLLAELPAQSSRIHLKDGQIQEGVVTSVREGKIFWQLQDGGATTSAALDRISFVELPTPSLWLESSEAYRTGDIAGAIAKLEQLEASRSSTMYPAPGNFSSLATWRLIDLYRRAFDAAAIQEASADLNWEYLPPTQRKDQPLVEIWSRIADRDWGTALERIEAAPELPAFSRNALELELLRGIALDGSGDSEAAIIHWGGVHALWNGAHRDLAAESVQRSVQALESMAGREREVQALVHLYAELYGEGTLWEGASAQAERLLNKSLELPEG